VKPGFLFLWSIASLGAQDFQARNLTVNGISRRYLIRASPAKIGPPSPLVIMLHGHGGSADQITGKDGKKGAPYRIWLDIARRENLTLVAPEGLKGSDGKLGWNDCRGDASTNPKSDDVAFIDALLQNLVKEQSIDPSRVFAIGTSNGGHMALRLAAERPTRFTAIAAVIASMPKNSQCAEPTRPVPMMFINGTRDPFVPYEGGFVGKGSYKRGADLSTQDSVRLWVKVNHAKAEAEFSEKPDLDQKDSSRVFIENHPALPGGAPVLLYRIEGGGHSEPSQKERYGWIYRQIVGAQNGDIELAEEVWAFFKTQTPQAQ
jgi:polyhydroxybutyrate depolymerase